MLSDANCANHPERAAEIVCARCGTFVCGGCIVSGDLCAECKRRLLKEQTPWTPQEKSRAVARRCLRWAQRLSTPTLVSSVAAMALHFTDSVVAARALMIFAALLGLVLVGLAGRGYASSEGGRPGPAVPGVFPRATAAILGVIGVAPMIGVVVL